MWTQPKERNVSSLFSSWWWKDIVAKLFPYENKSPITYLSRIKSEINSEKFKLLMQSYLFRL